MDLLKWIDIYIYIFFCYTKPVTDEFCEKRWYYVVVGLYDSILT